MKNHILPFIIVLLLMIFKVEGVYASSLMNYYSITTFEGLPSNTVGAIKKMQRDLFGLEQDLVFAVSMVVRLRLIPCCQKMIYGL